MEQTEIDDISGVELPAPVRPAGWKKRHRWPKAWAVWCAFTEWVYRRWPRNS